MLKIGFLGGGNMARAIVAGLVASGIPGDDVTVMDRHPEKLAKLNEQFGVRMQTALGDWVSELDIVVLAVKPQGLKDFSSRPLRIFPRKRRCFPLRRPCLPKRLSAGSAQNASCVRCPIRRRWSAKALPGCLLQTEPAKRIAEEPKPSCARWAPLNGSIANPTCTW